MFGKMMNSFYYGKSGKGDYNREDLPSTRWQLFGEMLKIRLSALCRLNLMYMLAWLPALIVMMLAATQYYSGVVNLSELQAQAAEGAIAAEVLAEGVFLFNDYTKAVILQTLLLLVPCLALTGPFTAGIAYVTRNWARDEHAFIWSDFRDAMKDNWKQALAVSAITGLMPLILYVCWSFYGELSGQNPLFVVPQILSLMLVVVWLCSLLFQYPLMVTYRLRFRDLMRNSLLLTVGRLPMVAGLKLLSLVPTVIALAVAFFTPYMQYALLVLMLYYIVFGFSLSRFISASYSNAVFDRYINPNIEGAQINRGLYNEEEDNEEAIEAEQEQSAEY